MPRCAGGDRHEVSLKRPKGKPEANERRRDPARAGCAAARWSLGRRRRSEQDRQDQEISADREAAAMSEQAARRSAAAGATTGSAATGADAGAAGTVVVGSAVGGARRGRDRPGSPTSSLRSGSGKPVAVEPRRHHRDVVRPAALVGEVDQRAAQRREGRGCSATICAELLPPHQAGEPVGADDQRVAAAELLVA